MKVSNHNLCFFWAIGLTKRKVNTPSKRRTKAVGLFHSTPRWIGIICQRWKQFRLCLYIIINIKKKSGNKNAGNYYNQIGKEVQFLRLMATNSAFQWLEKSPNYHWHRIYFLFFIFKSIKFLKAKPIAYNHKKHNNTSYHVQF